MLAVYGIDVLDPATTLRRVKTLTERLPAGSWPDVEHAMSWSTESYLLAQLVDEVAALTWVTARVYGGKSAAPKPFPRPAPPRRAPRSTWADVAAELTGRQGVVTHGGR